MPEGRYANHLEVGCNEEEVVMDFGQVFDDEAPLTHTRIVTQPVFARQMMRILRESLADDPEPRAPGREKGPNWKR